MTDQIINICRNDTVFYDNFIRSCVNIDKLYYKKQFNKFVELFTHSNGNINDAMYDYSIAMIEIIERLDNYEFKEHLTIEVYSEFIDLVHLYKLGMLYLINTKKFDNISNLCDDIECELQIDLIAESFITSTTFELIDQLSYIAGYIVEHCQFDDIFYNVNTVVLVKLSCDIFIKNKNYNIIQSILNDQNFDHFITKEQRDILMLVNK